MTDTAEGEKLISLPKVLWILGSLALTTAGITLLFLGMRSVMEIGGACASGGPFVPVRPCPEGVPALMIGGIWIGILAAFAYGFASISAGVPSFLGLFWPALFVSLGWNFLEYAFNPPFGDPPVWGWLVPGILFQAMGLIPLWLLIKSGMLFRTRSDRVRSALSMPGAQAVATAIRAATAARRNTTPVEERPDIVSELERLDSLHRSGALSDAEYEKAKRRLLA